MTLRSFQTSGAFLIIILFLSACGNTKLNQYKKIIQKADRFEILNKSNGRILDISKGQLANFKDVLTQNIKPDLQRNFVSNVKINIYESNEQIGFMMITTGAENPFVNFNSDSLHFGFGLTYRLGMTIDNMINQNDR